MHILTSWGVLGCPRVSWGIKTDRSCALGELWVILENMAMNSDIISCYFFSFFLFILPCALTDILGRLAQRLLVQDSKKRENYSTEV